ncbi:glycosyl hydrolase family 28-related protein [Pseudoroseicyclus aestuarii]|uniref:Pectate lyase-like protein n=1 Tax=Pseudoroseicyclus aestuarii TaxID=1795041 RepID=A0A318SW56_9RHOB|nr:glycosyl hydrolase family 28-related protein [Pseudoroseicyclus aestuarii]PYE84087.1 pectate lyase-like protein [Pseudoroseicyclus aestuarii]
MPITDNLTPTPFEDGLDVWSSGNGTPGSDTYAESGTGVFVPADQDFGGALEILKTQSVTRLRFMGRTPVRPGLYFRVTARVKAVAGAFPAVRIAGWAGNAARAHVDGLDETGPATQLTRYGEVVEISAIVGPGRREGVDLAWPGATYGHFGIDLTGSNGGVVRVDDIEIEDITALFLSESLGVVDVRDYGAVGDGSTDDSAAFEAADAAAAGRLVLVPDGVFFLDGDVTFQSPVRFEGRVTMPAARKLILQRNYDFDSYLAAFREEELAFRKAFQALLNFSDHESLDLGGRRINLTGPLDMQACDPGRTSFATRRVIRNGQFQALDSPAWDDAVVTAQARYDPEVPLTLSNVPNAGAIAVGSLVTGNGVGREVYVRAVFPGQGRVVLSQPLHDAEGVQSYTFRRFRYMLDFSGYTSLAQFVLDDIDFQCRGRASGILLAPDGLIFHVRDCFINRPKDRGITSHGEGCQGMLIDRCIFQSAEAQLPVAQRRSIGFNTNANDVKVRENRAALFRHFAVMAGSTNIVAGNHWFQGDDTGVRVAGLIITQVNPTMLVANNYIDNNFIEWTNEHDSTPEFTAGYSYGGLTIEGNIFFASAVSRGFNWVVIKPYGPGHFLNGFTMTGNVFRTINGTIERVEAVDTSLASLNLARSLDVEITGNVFHGVEAEIANPVTVVHAQGSATRAWVVNPAPKLPFGGRARAVESVIPIGPIRNAANGEIYEAPWIDPEFGDGRLFRVVFGSAARGTIRARVRMDRPD